MNSRTLKPGFTVMEILIVIGIIAGLLLFFGRRIAQAPEQIKRTKAQVELQDISGSVMRYELEKGKYPDSLNELVAEYKVPTKDPWGKPYVYRRTSEGYELYSRGGKDKKPIRLPQD